MSARRPHLYLLLLLAITTAAVPALAAHPEAAADFALINQDGATVRLSQFRGRLMLPAAKPGLIDHALPILVIDRQGHVLGHYEPDFDPQAVLRHLSGLLDR